LSAIRGARDAFLPIPEFISLVNTVCFVAKVEAIHRDHSEAVSRITLVARERGIA